MAGGRLVLLVTFVACLVFPAVSKRKRAISKCLLKDIQITTSNSGSKNQTGDPLQFDIAFDPHTYKYEIDVDFAASDTLMVYASADESRCVVLPSVHRQDLHLSYLPGIMDIERTFKQNVNETYVTKKRAEELKKQNATHPFSPDTAPTEEDTPPSPSNAASLPHSSRAHAQARRVLTAAAAAAAGAEKGEDNDETEEADEASDFSPDDAADPKGLYALTRQKGGFSQTSASTSSSAESSWDSPEWAHDPDYFNPFQGNVLKFGLNAHTHAAYLFIYTVDVRQVDAFVNEKDGRFNLNGEEGLRVVYETYVLHLKRRSGIETHLTGIEVTQQPHVPPPSKSKAAALQEGRNENRVDRMGATQMDKRKLPQVVAMDPPFSQNVYSYSLHVPVYVPTIEMKVSRLDGGQEVRLLVGEVTMRSSHADDFAFLLPGEVDEGGETEGVEGSEDIPTNSVPVDAESDDETTATPAPKQLTRSGKLRGSTSTSSSSSYPQYQESQTTSDEDYSVDSQMEGVGGADNWVSSQPEDEGGFGTVGLPAGERGADSGSLYGGEMRVRRRLGGSQKEKESTLSASSARVTTLTADVDVGTEKEIFLEVESADGGHVGHYRVAVRRAGCPADVPFWSPRQWTCVDSCPSGTFLLKDEFEAPLCRQCSAKNCVECPDDICAVCTTGLVAAFVRERGTGRTGTVCMREDVANAKGLQTASWWDRMDRTQRREIVFAAVLGFMCFLCAAMAGVIFYTIQEQRATRRLALQALMNDDDLSCSEEDEEEEEETEYEEEEEDEIGGGGKGGMKGRGQRKRRMRRAPFSSLHSHQSEGVGTLTEQPSYMDSEFCSDIGGGVADVALSPPETPGETSEVEQKSAQDFQAKAARARENVKEEQRTLTERERGPGPRHKPIRDSKVERALSRLHKEGRRGNRAYAPVTSDDPTESLDAEADQARRREETEQTDRMDRERATQGRSEMPVVVLRDPPKGKGKRDDSSSSSSSSSGRLATQSTAEE
uniref:TNFR-Cys domain-containing protein n=1 Tax=Chromera velia CCMP2878 TaxID=1169474 RepID=A0A0G4F8A5_9ALVE|eukprot:Cvel_15751.t1-p1 / transcript=Cvel_15751.t1 / gene=Cvel_15751 / organism=Chromera_velia_CCMP2878 / gene_product=hypothetical protein / transcript_product=hypothetical protein / location=Cvel_scaffold1179:38312-46508(-) / protein_length=1000 / sequence_SO=supercontig / SO=protein_coding / is_pseudo=false